MSTTALETLIDQFEARLISQIPTAVLLDRLDGPKDSPSARAHKGIRVWPVSTSTLDQYAQNDLIRVADDIEVESCWRITRDANASMGAALSWEREIIIALTNATWYDSPDGVLATADRYEVHYAGSTREKEEGWILLTTTFRVLRDAAIGGP